MEENVECADDDDDDVNEWAVDEKQRVLLCLLNSFQAVSSRKQGNGNAVDDDGRQLRRRTTRCTEWLHFPRMARTVNGLKRLHADDMVGVQRRDK